jgi:aldose sugar dehydrogenase
MTTLKDSKLYQLKLNSTHDSIISSSVIPNVSFGRLRDICIAPSGKIYISTSNSSASGTGGRVDKIIELYDPTVNAVNDITEANDITIYPNPTGDYTVIKLPNSLYVEQISYTLTDETGKLVMKGSLRSNNNTLSTKELAPGVYTIKITADEGKTYTGKIMKQ